MNESKTNYIFFHTSIEVHKEVCIDGQCIPSSNSASFLGIQTDDRLNWKAHIDGLCTKLSRICYSFCIVKMYLPFENMRTIYFSSFQSIFKYGIVF